MSQVITEGVNLACVVESTLGATTPPTTGWFNLQPNSLGAIGPTYKKLARDPISKNRQNQRPILVDEDSQAPWESDVTKDLVDDFLEGIFMSATKHSGGTGTARFMVTPTTGSPGTISALTATAITVAAGGALAQNVLVYMRGFATASNNGLKVVGAASTNTSIVITGGLVADAAPSANAMAEVAGVQGVASDIGIDVNGNITSTALDFTTLGLNVGQWIWLGGDPTNATLNFATAGYRGFARLKAISAHLLTLERRSWTVGAADTGTGKTIQVLFGRWIRNVAIDSADYKTPSYAFEVTYPNLQAVGTPEYEYLLGNMVDEFVFNIPLTQKATAQMKFMGTTSLDPATARVTGPSIAINPVTNLAVSTSTDVMRLRVSNTDETGISTDFQSCKMTIKNNISPEKELGQLGAKLMNVGRFEVMVEMDVIFTSDQVIKAIHDNRQASMDIGLRNGDFGVLLDLSSMSIDSGDRKFEKNKSVVIQAKTTGFQDPTLSFTLGASIFPYLPSS